MVVVDAVVIVPCDQQHAILLVTWKSLLQW